MRILLGLLILASSVWAQGVLHPRLLSQAGATNGQCLVWSSGGGVWQPANCASSGITSLNALTGSSQTFANDTNITISSSGTTHTLGWAGQLAPGRGGSGADLSATGGSGQFVRQNSVGGAFTVSAIGDSDVPNTITLDNINQITSRSHTALSDIGSNTHAQIDTHIAATAAHGATGANVGTTNTQDLSNKRLVSPILQASAYDATWAVSGACSGTNGGALTVNGSNQIVCSDDDGGAGGATNLSAMYDFAIRRFTTTTTNDTLGIGQNCTTTNPCVWDNNGVVASITSEVTAQLTGTSSGGTLYVYIDADNVLTCDENTAATLTPTGCTAATTGGFPATAIKRIAAATFTANAFDSITAAMNLRSFFNGAAVACGDGLSCGINATTGKRTLSADSTLQTVVQGQSNSHISATTGGTSTAYTLTLSPVPASYSGLVIYPTFHTACGSNPTINVNSLGARKIYKTNGTSAPAQISTDECRAVRYALVYDPALDSGTGGFLMDTGGGTSGTSYGFMSGPVCVQHAAATGRLGDPFVPSQTDPYADLGDFGGDSTNGIRRCAARFADGVTGTIGAEFRLPSNYATSGQQMDVTMTWTTGTTGGTNNSRVDLSVACVSSSESINPASPTWTNVTPATYASTGNSLMSEGTWTNYDMSGCAPGDLAKFRIRRLGGDSLDTLSDSFYLYHMTWRWVETGGGGGGGGGGITTLASQTGATQTITRGIGIAGSSTGNDHAFTLDLAELVANQTIFDSSQATRTITFGLSGSNDPVLTLGDNVFNVSTGTIQQGGVAVLLNGGALGTPSSGTLTNATGLPISTGVSGLGSGVATFLATPSSANLAAAVTGETGTDALVFANTPTLVTPVLGAATATSIAFGANPADDGYLRASNNVNFLCGELATPGTDKCMKLNTSDQFEFDAIVVATGFQTTGTSPYLELVQGTASAASANAFRMIPPTSITTAYRWIMPGGVGATGVVKGAVSGNDATISIAALVDGDIPSAIARDSEINVQGTANEIASSGSGVSPTLSLPATLDLSGKVLLGASPLVLEGATADAFETTVAVTDPTADRTFTIPNADSVAVQPDAGASNQFLTAISAAGVISKAQPAFSNLSGTATAGQLPAATTSAQGAVELATQAETTTGSDTVRAVTPDGLRGSDYGKKMFLNECVADATALSTGDGKCYIGPFPSEFNGWNIVKVTAGVGAAVSSSGAVTVDIDRCGVVATGVRCSGTNVSIFSTLLTIDANEDSTDTAATANVINTSNDDITTDQWLRVNIDGAGTGTQGLYVWVILQKP